MINTSGLKLEMRKPLHCLMKEWLGTSKNWSKENLKLVLIGIVVTWSSIGYQMLCVWGSECSVMLASNPQANVWWPKSKSLGLMNNWILVILGTRIKLVCAEDIMSIQLCSFTMGFHSYLWKTPMYSLVPRAFHRLHYGKAGKGLVSFLTWVTSG